MIKMWNDLRPYEKRLCLLLMMTSSTNAFSVLSSLFLQYTPKHHCDIDNLLKTFQGNIVFNQTLNTSGYETILEFWIPFDSESFGKQRRSSCLQYNRSQEDIKRFMAGTFDEQNETATSEPCIKKKFYFEESETSAVQEFDMICDGSWRKTAALMNFMLGKLIGSLVGGMISDRFGRRTAFLLFTFVQFSGSFIIAFSNNFSTYVGVLLFVGSGSLVNYAAAVTLGNEIVDKNHRNVLVTFLAIGYALGNMLTPLVGFAFRNWRWYAAFTGAVGVVYIPYYWLLDESPAWLFSVGKTQEAKKVLDKIAMINEESVSQLELVILQREDSNITEKNMWKSWWLLLKSPILVLRLFVVCCAWIVCNMSYYAIVLDTNSLSGNRFLNCFYSGVVELVGYFLSYAMVELGGRKKTFICFMSLTGVFIALTPFVTISGSGTAGVVLTMLSKLCASIGFYVAYINVGEIFPTTIRHSTMAVASAFGRLGGIIAPVIMHTGKGGTKFTPYVISGAVSLFVALLYTTIPQTHNKPLPQTIEDAVGMQQGLFGFAVKINSEHRERASKSEPAEL